MRAPPLKSISSSDVGLLDPINPPNLSRTPSSLSLMETDEKRQPSWSHEHEPELEKWNGTRTNAFRYVATLYSFIVMGMNDGAVGIESYYDVSYTVVSLLFLAPFVGYIIAALTNNFIHHQLGQRGIAIIGPIARTIGFLPLALHPPYPVLPFALLVTGYGNGLEDSGWNAWIGNMQNSNELLGFLHGAYGLGATVGPLIASAMVARADLEWFNFYYVMTAMTALTFILTSTAFWKATGKVHREKHPSSTDGANHTSTVAVIRKPITWLLAFYLLAYVGIEVALGGWIVTFMLRVRHAEPFLAGITTVLFWLGLTLGRLVLGFVTGRVGEKRAIAVYVLLSIVLQLLYWLVPNFVASVIFVMLLGFFLGPLFPAAIVAAAKLLPRDNHVSVIGFAAAFGGAGGAIIPFGIGAIANSRGVWINRVTEASSMAFALKFDIPLSVRSFAPFPKLPTEIRQQIWEHAIFEPGMQYLRIDTKARSFVSHGSVALGPPDSDDEDDDVLPDFSQERRHGPLVPAALKPRFAAPRANLSNHVSVNQIMATLSVTCSEARSVVQRLASHPRTLKLDDGRVVSLGAADDVVLLEYIPLKSMGAGCRLALNISCDQLANIRRVAVQYCPQWEGATSGYYCRLCGEHHFGSRKRTYPLHLYEFLARHLPNLEAFYFVDYMILRKPRPEDDDDFDIPMADCDDPQSCPREGASKSTGRLKAVGEGSPRRYKSARHLFEEVDEDDWVVRDKVLDTLSWVRKRFNQYATQSKFSKHKHPSKVRFGVLAFSVFILNSLWEALDE
ncbi:Bypass of stop codon protein 6 [Colletotrichum sp. SAR 10_76]|nr:Bypass of stop codon protein 6 [Colletotrichum sp. SAR 10_76]